ncbi:MAG: hypothetical protein F6J97_04040 [Leptolyngbya sp. SIO4C1]|nr:hypothetical protein [Leptolyngbya sp. SIO4C1]
MVNATPAIATDTWVEATWDEFLTLTDHPDLEKAGFHYDLGWMRSASPS